MTLSRTKLAFAGIAAALSLAMTPALHAKEAAPTAFDPIAHKRVVEVSEQLRCLVCQNQSIADSNAELAVDLRNQVIEQVKAGKTNKEIVDYMVERYGDFVLYKPPFKLSTAIRRLLHQPAPQKAHGGRSRQAPFRAGQGARRRALERTQGVSRDDDIHHHLRRHDAHRDSRRGPAALVWRAR